MLILKRLLLWAGETLSAAVLIGIFLYLDLGALPEIDKSEVLTNLVGYTGMTLIIFMIGSLYIFTTAFFGVIYRSPRFWQYPVIAAGLFVIHLQFYFDGWTMQEKLPIHAVGVCVVLICDFTGNWLLRKWTENIVGSQRSSESA